MSINQNDIDLIRQAMATHVGTWSDERQKREHDIVRHLYDSVDRLQNLLSGDDWTADEFSDTEKPKMSEHTCTSCGVAMFHTGPYFPSTCDDCYGNDEAVT